MSGYSIYPLFAFLARCKTQMRVSTHRDGALRSDYCAMPYKVSGSQQNYFFPGRSLSQDKGKLMRNQTGTVTLTGSRPALKYNIKA